MEKHPSGIKLESWLVSAGRGVCLPPSLLRLSVGIEDAEDLWADLDAAISAAVS